MIKLWIEDGSGQVPSQGDLEDIATSYGMTSVPNLADDSNIWVDYENDFGIPVNALYRAYRIPKDHAGLAGRDL